MALKRRRSGALRRRRQPRTDRPGAVEHRRQRDQIFRRCVRTSRRVRVTLEKSWRRNPASRLRQRPRHPGRADRERATERFVRLEKSRSQPGSGLGLSLAKAVMKFHGGRLDLAARQSRTIRGHDFPGRERGMMTARVGETDAGRDWLLQPAAKLAAARCRPRPARAGRDRGRGRAKQELPRLAAFLAGKGAAQDFLAAVFDLSPFLRDCARRRPQMLDALFDQTVESGCRHPRGDRASAARRGRLRNRPDDGRCAT